MQRLGSKQNYKYHIFQHGWNAYLRMIDFDFTYILTCPTCKDSPEVIILDGITMGTSKEIPDSSPEFDENQFYSPIALRDRLFISESKLRKELHEYCLNGLNVERYKETTASLRIEFAEYIKYGSLMNAENITSINLEYPNVKKIIELLNRSEPITGLFPFSLLTNAELLSVVELSKERPVELNCIALLFQKMQSLEILFNSFQTLSTNGGQFTLHPIIASLLRIIMSQIDSLYKNPTRILVEVELKHEDYFNYFPAFKKKYK